MSSFYPTDVSPMRMQFMALIAMVLTAIAATPSGAEEQSGLLETIHHHPTLTTTLMEKTPVPCIVPNVLCCE